MKTLYEVTIKTKFTDGETKTVKHLFSDVYEARQDLKNQEEYYKSKKYTYIPRNPAALDFDPVFCQFKEDNGTLHTVYRGQQYLYETADEAKHSEIAVWDK